MSAPPPPSDRSGATNPCALPIRTGTSSVPLDVLACTRPPCGEACGLSCAECVSWAASVLSAVHETPVLSSCPPSASLRGVPTCPDASAASWDDVHREARDDPSMQVCVSAPLVGGDVATLPVGTGDGTLYLDGTGGLRLSTATTTGGNQVCVDDEQITRSPFPPTVPPCDPAQPALHVRDSDDLARVYCWDRAELDGQCRYAFAPTRCASDALGTWRLVLDNVAGFTGPQGSRGATGPSGPRGARGPTGPTGLVGNTGPRGPRGRTGPTGVVGGRGRTGVTGPMGNRGARGPKGTQGARGQTGRTVTELPSQCLAVPTNRGTVEAYTQIIGYFFNFPSLHFVAHCVEDRCFKLYGKITVAQQWFQTQQSQTLTIRLPREGFGDLTAPIADVGALPGEPGQFPPDGYDVDRACSFGTATTTFTRGDDYTKICLSGQAFFEPQNAPDGRLLLTLNIEPAPVINLFPLCLARNSTPYLSPELICEVSFMVFGLLVPDG